MLPVRGRAVMPAASGRGARMDTCPERHVLLLEAATVMVMSLLVRALLLVIFLTKVMQEVVQVKALLV